MSNPYRHPEAGRRYPANVWPAHPTWRHRFDFVTASPPVGRVVVRHTAAVSYLDAGVGRIYITHLHWRGRSGAKRTLTRAELVNALHALCGRYEFVEGVTLSYAARKLRAAPPPPADTEGYAAWNAVMGVVNDVQAPAYFFAAAYAQQLSLLSDAEAARVPPPTWARSIHDIHALVEGRASLHWSRFERDSAGAMTDFVCDVARKALNRQLPLPAAHAARVLEVKTMLEKSALGRLPTYAESEARK